MRRWGGAVFFSGGNGGAALAVQRQFGYNASSTSFCCNPMTERGYQCKASPRSAQAKRAMRRLRIQWGNPWGFKSPLSHLLS
jgi:hypothetical protein